MAITWRNPSNVHSTTLGSSLFYKHGNICATNCHKMNVNVIEFPKWMRTNTQKLTSWFNMGGKMSSKAFGPTVECKLSNVFAAASLTSGKGSHSAFLTVGTNELTNVNTISLEVDVIISDRPMQTPCRWSDWFDWRPFSKIGIISGSTLSPSLRTRSPSVLAATLNEAHDKKVA